MSRLVLKSCFTAFMRGLPSVKNLHTCTKHLSSQSPQCRLAYVKYGTLVFAAGVTGAYYYQPRNRVKRKLEVYMSGICGFFRSLYTGLRISLDYWWSLWGLEEGTKEYEEAIHPVHQRAADRILDTCLRNGGLYRRLNEELMSHNHSLPNEYVDTLKTLQDKCSTPDKSELKESFLEEFGVPHTEMFESFDEEPIATTSTAQVFHAKTKDGAEVAVKVQYRDLPDRFTADVLTMKFLLKIVGWLRPDFDFVWYLEVVRENLKEELNYRNEAINSHLCAYHHFSLSHIYVPQAYWKLTTKRILTTEFIHGTKISDAESLERQGFSLADIDRKLFQAFAQQIFEKGFVHANPHPGNVLVRKAVDGKAELVLLGHGLYVKLQPPIRKALCHLWEAFVMNNHFDMKTHASELGVEDYCPLVEILTYRPLNVSMKFKTRITEEDIKHMREMACSTSDKVMEALRSMPRSMFLVIKTLHTIRAIARDHGDPVDLNVVLARSAFEEKFWPDETGLLQRMSSFLSFEFMLWHQGAKMQCIQLYFSVLQSLGRAPDVSSLMIK